MLTCLPGWWNNEMKPDRVSCCCFDCKQFSHFHPGPRYKYWHLVIWKVLEHWILQSSHRDQLLNFESRLSFSAIDNTRQFQGFSVALDLKKCKEANLLKTFCQPGFEWTSWAWGRRLLYSLDGGRCCRWLSDFQRPRDSHTFVRTILETNTKIRHTFVRTTLKNFCLHCRQKDTDNKKNI